MEELSFIYLITMEIVWLIMGISIGSSISSLKHLNKMEKDLGIDKKSNQEK